MTKSAPVLLAMALVACTPGKSDNGAQEQQQPTNLSAATLFRRCSACHTITAGGPNSVGPNLYGVFGRKAASAEGYRYSPALASSGLVWDEATLDRFLESPRDLVPGTKMTFAGLKRPEQRRTLIDFLKSGGKTGP